MLDVKDLNFRFKNNLILDKVNLSVDKGEVVCLIGDNGSGKTTLIKVLMGMYPTYKGEVNFSCNDYFGIVEEPGFFMNETGMENLKHMLVKDFSDDVNKYIELFDMSEYINQKVKEYSQGMRQKLALVTVFASSADIIFFDEPLNSLDKNSKKVFADIVKSQSELGKSFIISSHIFEQIDQLYNRCFLIKDGHLSDEKFIFNESMYVVSFEKSVDINTINGIDHSKTERIGIYQYVVKLEVSSKEFIIENLNLDISEIYKTNVLDVIMNRLNGGEQYE